MGDGAGGCVPGVEGREAGEHHHEHGPRPGGPAVPPAALLWRGAGLLGLGAGLGWLGWRLVRASLLSAPAGLALIGGGLLAAWAAAIHLTGGEQFDDWGCD
ncbi:hypothetical protein [Tepidiforma sp.]|uniref:hypothetical protein n=1 Tax=Tepidiforma sp. TaxID=2682230 RepID=UPI002ADD9997|nr:hypothetical protein [Tepidiforma sp.]